MQKITAFFKAQRVILITIAVSVVLIALSLFIFSSQMNKYIDQDMREQIDAIQKSSVRIAQNDLNYLKRITASVAQLIDQTEIKTDADILSVLKNYAKSANIVRTLFITLDGHAYTSYAGYLGQSEASTSIDGISLSDITYPVFSQPYYAEDLDTVIFGVISPVTMAGKKGVLVSSYNAREFHALLQNEFVRGSTKIGILSNKGTVFIAENPGKFQTNVFDSLKKVTFAQSSVQEMQTNFANSQAGFCSYFVDGVEQYFSYAPLGINDWVLVITINKVSLYRNLTQLQAYGLQLTGELVAIMAALLFVIIFVRYKEHKKTQISLKRAAALDGLTGVLNRSATEREIECCLNGGGSAFLLIDIDNFKSINDNLGHVTGDTVLRKCAQYLQKVFGEENIVGRIGGDEFVVFVKKCAGPDGVRAKAEQFIEVFHANAYGEAGENSVSIGITLSGEGSSFTALYQQADAALYRAKELGKSRFVFYDKDAGI